MTEHLVFLPQQAWQCIKGHLGIKDGEIVIKNEACGIVSLSKEDWENIQETLYLFSVPGMKESLLEAMNEPLEQYTEHLDW